MSALSASETVALAVGLILTVVLIGVAFYVLRRLRARRQHLHGDSPPTPEVASDRAFNRLAMARTEVDVLERQGVDVGRARDLVHLSEASFGRREFDRAYELAQSAHESLVVARRGAKSGAPRPSAPVPTAPLLLDPKSAVAPPATGTRADPPISPEPAMSKVPKNRVESQFEMRLLDGDLEAANRDRPSQAGTQRAAKLRKDAQAAYDRADYTEAFRLALRGRREVGGKVETLDLGPPLSSAATPGSAAASPESANPMLEAERVAGSERCPQCGHPNLSSDAFCRGCGIPTAPAACPKCGEPRRKIDTFCGRCGQKFA